MFTRNADDRFATHLLASLFVLASVVVATLTYAVTNIQIVA